MRQFIYSLITFLLVPLFGLSQLRITGKLVDGITKEPISNATIYIDKTQKTTLSDEQGNFHFNDLPPNAVIIITHTSYEKGRSEIINVRDTLRIELFPRNVSLENVIVQSRINDTWQKWGRLFNKILIGQGLEDECILKNPQDVRFQYDKTLLILKARARKPLLIENKMLGFVIHLDLDSLVYSFETGDLFYAMTEYFEQIRPNDEKEQKMIAANRLMAYRGSMMHFSRALYNNKLDEEGFQLYQYKGIFNHEKRRVESLLMKTLASYNESNLKETDNKIDLDLFERDTARYYRKVLDQRSYFFQDSLYVNFAERWTNEIQKNCLFYMGSDSLLLAYKGSNSSILPNQMLKYWTRMKEPGSNIKRNYDFFQTPGGKEKYTMMYLLKGEKIKVSKNGFIENKNNLFLEGYMADNRQGYDLPWDYDSETDERSLLNEQITPTSETGSIIENKLQRMAANHSSTELYLHLDKTIYDPGENIWFAAYVIRSPFKQDAHHTLYACLQNQFTKKVVASEQFVMSSGLGAGYVYLPDSLPPGSYHLIAYTNTWPDEKNAVVFDQAIVLRPHTMPYSIEYSETANKYLNDSVFINCHIKNEFNKYASGLNVSYQLIADGKLLASGKTRINENGQLQINGIRLQSVVGKKLSLLTDIPQKKVTLQLRNEISISGNFIRIRWFPEGGDLVDGLPTKLSYEISDMNDQPVTEKIKLLKNKEFITDLNTDGSGSGTIGLIPAIGQYYSVALYSDDLTIMENEFPIILKQGYSIYLDHGVVDDSLRFLIRSAKEKVGLYVMVHNYKLQYYFDKIVLPGKEKWISLPGRMIQEGLATITLFDENGNPVAERSIFREPLFHPDLQIELDSASYRNRSKVNVKLKATDGSGNPVQSIFSIACVLKSRIDTTRFQDIVSFSYLNNYKARGVFGLKPDYSNYVRERMERFLLIQGWTRYKWQDMMVPDVVDKTPSVSLIQHGYVLFKGSRLIKPVNIFLFTQKSFQTITTDETGYFEINENSLITEPDGKLSLAVEAKYQRDYSIILLNDNETLQNKLAALEYPVPQQLLYHLQEEPDELPIGKLLAPAFVNTVFKKEVSALRVYPKTYSKEEAECADYVCVDNYLNCIVHHTGKKPIRGHQYNYKTECYTIKFIYLGCWDGGYLPILEIQEDTGIVVYKLKGRYYSKEIYKPDYKKDYNLLPETLTTIYWDPFIQTNIDGESVFSFYTNDLKGNLILIAEGIGGGSVLSAKRIFRVGQ